MITRKIQYQLAKNAVGPFLMALDRWQQAQKQRKRKPRETPFGPPLEAVQKLKEIMTQNYFEGRYADGAVPVVWVTSGFPAEVFFALGFHVVYPENHAALCSTRHKVTEIAEFAERDGLSRDVCSYARTDIGSVISGKTPVGRLPKPDMIACCTNICQTVLYWYRNLAEYLNVPLVLVDTPFMYGGTKEHHLAYVSDQLGEVIEFAEKISHRKMDSEKLARVVENARDGSRLWGECLAISQARPAPWTGIDTFFHIAPIVTIRGTEVCNAYYRLLKDELTQRVAAGIGGIKNEKHRLLWDNLPIWFKVREHSTMTAERGFNFVCATYSNAWAEAGDLIDPAHPLESAAKTYTYVYLNRDLNNRLKTTVDLAKSFGVDGAVLHSDRSCKPYSVGQVDVKERLQKDMGIRVLLLEADHADERSLSGEQAEMRLLAFMESFNE